MDKRARDVMTRDPVCCTPTMTLDDVAKLMAHHDCGEIPVLDHQDHIVGVVTDRDIACRVVAEGKNPMAYTVDTCMTAPVVVVRDDAPLKDVIATMERHQIRRAPVVDEHDACVGIISQSDLSSEAPLRDVGQLVREVSREPDENSH